MTLDLDIRSASAGVDWLTITCADPDMARELVHLVDYACEALAQRGYLRKPWAWKGYGGWQCAGLRYGTREDGTICVLSGEEARRGWGEMLRYRTNVTRIDLALTFELNVPHPDVAKICHLELVRMRRDGESLRVQHFPLVDNDVHGQTLYVGSRRSDQFGRLYDKGLESGSFDQPGCAWRYEVEYKRSAARQVADQLFDDYNQTADVSARVASTVNDWFSSRYVPCAGDHWTKPYTVQIEARVNDIDKTLEWFSRQIRPSVRRLFASGVPVERVLDALGIDPHQAPNT